MKSSVDTAGVRFGVLALFAGAMGFLEAIVVVYLRKIYYPQGFEFPLVLPSPDIYKAELIRELATLVMLGSVAWIAGNSLVRRLTAFLFCFAVWDITYYVALKLLLNWPDSLMTWDILFLIPVTWVGPVLAPVINSLTMIGMALVWMKLEKLYGQLKLNLTEWLLIFPGAFFVFITYVWDYSVLVSQSVVFSTGGGMPAIEKLLEAIKNYIPDKFNWILFIAGELLILTSLLLTWRRSSRKRKMMRNAESK